MAFTLEDGTGVAGANAYITVAEFKTYHKDRGNDVTTLTAQGTTALQQLIVKATDYIEQRYAHRFKGQREFPETPQGLSFPRVRLYDREGQLVTGIPTKLKNAVAEYAWIVDAADLFLTPTTEDVGLVPTHVRDKIGPIETERRYLGSGSQGTIKPLPKADTWLREYLTPAGGTERA